MKIIIFISILLIAIFSYLLYAAYEDIGDKQVCTKGLETCVTECPKDEYFKGGICVVRCAFANVVCLFVSGGEK